MSKGQITTILWKVCRLTGSKYKSQSYILSFNYYAIEILETKQPLICKSLARGQIAPEILEAIVYVR